MWLINTETLKLEEHSLSTVRRSYAILSHMWGDGEVTFQDYLSADQTIQAKKGWQKILRACTEAKNANLPHVWVDTWYAYVLRHNRG